jgi:hypothetical protein
MTILVKVILEKNDPIGGSYREALGACAVVRVDRDKPYQFTAWHPTFESAVIEAKRLCQEKGGEYVVLKAVATAERETPPVKITVALATGLA